MLLPEFEAQRILCKRERERGKREGANDIQSGDKNVLKRENK